jgi:nucleoid-associated protein EbfC
MAMNRDMMAKLAQMGEQINRAQAELAEKRAEGTAGGGAIHLVLTGGMQVDSIKIDKEVVDPEDVEMLEDLLTAALNEVLQKVQGMQMGQLAGLAGNLGIGGLPGMQQK